MSYEDFMSLPGRLLLDTCVLNTIQDEGEYIFENQLPDTMSHENICEDLRALRYIFQVNQRASFQFVVSPLTFAEISNQKTSESCRGRLSWALDVLDVWLVMLEESGDRQQEGGSVRHRFKLSDDLQALEGRLMKIRDFKRDPIDRLLLIQYKMGACDAFLTMDRGSILRHKNELQQEGIRVITPSDFWSLLKLYANIWY